MTDGENALRQVLSRLSGPDAVPRPDQVAAVDALLGAVIEIAAWKEVDVPSLRALYGLTKLAERNRRAD